MLKKNPTVFFAFEQTNRKTFFFFLVKFEENVCRIERSYGEKKKWVK